MQIEESGNLKILRHGRGKERKIRHTKLILYLYVTYISIIPY